jgi:hypothetical protein
MKEASRFKDSSFWIHRLRFSKLKASKPVLLVPLV